MHLFLPHQSLCGGGAVGAGGSCLSSPHLAVLSAPMMLRQIQLVHLLFLSGCPADNVGLVSYSQQPCLRLRLAARQK